MGKIDIGDVSVISMEEYGVSNLILLSDFIDAKYIGLYRFADFINEMKHIACMYAPVIDVNELAVFAANPRQAQRYALHVTTKKSGHIARIIDPDLYIAENSTIDLLIDTTHTVDLQIESERISFKDNTFKNVSLNLYNTIDSLFIQAQSPDMSVGGIKLQKVKINNAITNNLISTQFTYDNKGEKRNKGNISVFTELFNTGNENKIIANVNFKNSQMILNGDAWQIMPSQIKIDSSSIMVKNFKFYRTDQFLAIDGIISPNTDDIIKIELQDYDLASLNDFISDAGYKLNGNIGGTAQISNIYQAPMLIANFKLNNIIINNDTLGNVILDSKFDNAEKLLNINANIYRNRDTTAKISGYIKPQSGDVNFNLVLNKLKIGYIEPMLKNIISDIHGNASGKLLYKGKLNKPILSGKINLDQTSLLVDYLQTYYKIDALINVEESKISISNAKIYDINNHSGRLDVVLTHNKFNDIYFNAAASINNMMCLNTKSSDNPLFYGKAYATGGITITGYPTDIHFNITAQAERNSKLTIPLPSTATAKEISMLRFKTVDSSGEISKQKDNTLKKNKTHIDFGLDLTVTPETEIEILIDEKAGDILYAQGQGNLKIKVDPSIDLFSIIGDYNVNKGNYNFTIPNFNFISRRFNINENSHINFNGNIETALLDVNASYKPRSSVSLAPLIPRETAAGTNRRYPVDCQISITGQIAHPSLHFNIDFPNLDPETKALAMSAINTEEKMINQFLAILIMQSFIPDMQYENANNYDMSTSLLGNATTGLLSGQISNLISAFNLPLQLDLSVDMGMDENQQLNNFEMNMNMALFDRVYVNSRFGNNTNTAQTDRQFSGDFEVDFIIGSQDKYRFKVFTRSSDYFTNELETNMQGLGLLYQTQFDSFADLFRRKKKNYKKAEKESENKNDDEKHIDDNKN
jgi:hypothetical protein